MKFLYGSQNFGYDTEQSDKDWMEFRYPTWENIAKNEKISLEEKNSDGSITKVKDIRELHNIFYKGNMSDTQILFSVETYDCEDFQWFIQNRQSLLRINLWSTYRTTLGIISGEYNRGKTSKHVIRMKAWYDILESLAHNTEIEFYNPKLRALRLELETFSDKKLLETADVILRSTEEIKNVFEQHYEIVDTKLLKELDAEIVRLLRKRM